MNLFSKISISSFTDWLTKSGFDLAWFSSLSSGCLCIFMVLYVFQIFIVTFYILPFSELSLVGLALDLVDKTLSFSTMTEFVRNQFVPICSERWCTEANEATQTHCNNPVAPAYPDWAYYAHGRQRRCQEDPVSLPSGRLKKTTRSSPHHVAQHLPTGSETTPPYAPRCSRFGSEPLSVEDDVDVWRYAILELHARNDDDNNAMTLLVGSHKIITEVIYNVSKWTLKPTIPIPIQLRWLTFAGRLL